MTLRNADNISILGLTGELDPYEGREMMKRIGNLIRYKWTQIVLDLQEVNHIHFRVFSELLAASTACSLSTGDSGGIKLANLSPYLREIMKITGVDDRFETYDSVAEAVLSFQPGSALGVMQ